MDAIAAQLKRSDREIILRMASQPADEKLSSVVTAEFIRSRLNSEDRALLDKQLEFGDGLVDATYSEWIQEKAKKIFIILVHIGCPHHIFDIIDHAFDDDDLPLSSDEIAHLNLGDQDPLLNNEFSRAQAQFFHRENVASSEPTSADGKKPKAESAASVEKKLAIEVVRSARSIFSSSSTLTDLDTVRIAGDKSKTFTRRRIIFNQSPANIRQDDYFQDIDLIKRSTHRHIVNLRTAYLGQNCGYVLLSPTLDVPLRSFFDSPPKSFRSLPIKKQQETLLNWPHCLASAIFFLHDQGLPHGKILPSNIFIDGGNRIFLGFTVFTPSISCQRKDYEIESYDYGPPERWARASVVRSDYNQVPAQKAFQYPVGPSSNWSSSDSGSLHSYSGTVNSYTFLNDPSHRPSIDISALKPPLGALPPIPPSAHSKQAKGPLTNASSGSMKSPTMGGTHCSVMSGPTLADRGVPGYRHNSNSSGSGGSDGFPDDHEDELSQQLHNTLSLASHETETTIVTITQPQAADLRYGDIFTLACITLDLLTVLVKNKQSAFATHRAKKNRAIGLGGAPADASFHCNLFAVSTWMEDLEKTARQKSDALFRGVSPILVLVRRMLNTDPETRPPAIEIVRRMEDALVQSSKLPYLHCGGGGQC